MGSKKAFHSIANHPLSGKPCLRLNKFEHGFWGGGRAGPCTEEAEAVDRGGVVNV